MERLIIESLGACGVAAAVIEGLTGVWTLPSRREGDGATAADVSAGLSRKIGSIGVHVNRGVTTHGFAVNVNNDLQPFEWIVPCGIEGCRMTSLCRELGETRDMSAYMDVVVERFASIYDRRPHQIDATELADRVAGIEPLVAAGPAAAHATGNGTPAAVR